MSAKNKFAAVLATASMNESETSAYCRENGFYPEQIKAWRKACEQANDWQQTKQDDIATALREERKKVKQLERDNKRKEKALAEAAALLVLRKKVNAIWGDEDE